MLLFLPFRSFNFPDVLSNLSLFFLLVLLLTTSTRPQPCLSCVCSLWHLLSSIGHRLSARSPVAKIPVKISYSSLCQKHWVFCSPSPCLNGITLPRRLTCRSICSQLTSSGQEPLWLLFLVMDGRSNALNSASSEFAAFQAI